MAEKNTHGPAPHTVPAVLALVAVALALVASLWLTGLGERTSGPGEASQRPYVGGDLHSLAVDPTNPERVMVGGHDGGAISEDGGKTWEQASGLEGADPMGWVIDPTDPRKMYAGGHPGFYRSEDGGESWEQDNSDLPGTDVHGLGMDPEDPETLYAYVVDAGLLKSTDAGESWETVNAEYGAMGPILVDPRQTGTFYLAVMDGSFRRSNDGGKTWEVVGTIPGRMVMSSDQVRRAPDTFYAAGGGAFKSEDGGKSWRRLGEELPPSVSVVAVAQSDPNVVYAGALGQDGVLLFRSEDAGENWEAVN